MWIENPFTLSTCPLSKGYQRNKWQRLTQQRNTVVLTQQTVLSWTTEHGGTYITNSIILNNGTRWYLHNKRRHLEQRNAVHGTYITNGTILNNGTRWCLHNKRRHLKQRNAVVLTQQTVPSWTTEHVVLTQQMAPSWGPEFGTGRSQPHPWRTKRRCSEEKNGFIKVRRNHWNVTFSVVEIKSIIISIWKADMHLNTMNVPDMQRALRWGFTNIPGQPVVVSSK